LLDVKLGLVTVIGSKIRDELFGAKQALGEWICIGDRRFRVIGMMGSEGRSIGVDVQEIVIILILAEALLLSALGASIGLMLDQLGSLVIRYVFQELPAHAPIWAIVAA
jgi:hypothetical protein